jgi:calmodulin
MVLTENQENEMKNIFTKYSSGGSIGSSEIAKACRAAGLNPTEGDLVLWKGEVKKGLDVNGFQKFMGMKLDETGDSVEEIVEAFQSFDTQGTGRISVKELKAILTTMGEKLSEKEYQVLLEECDVDNGSISYLQLSHMLFGASGDE